MNRLNRMLYKDLDDRNILEDMIWLNQEDENILENCHAPIERNKKLQNVIYNLSQHGWENGFTGNLWHTFLTLQILKNENPFSLACERTGTTSGTLYQLALGDFEIFKELFSLSPIALAQDEKEVHLWKTVLDYKGNDIVRPEKSRIFSTMIRDEISKLAQELGTAVTAENMIEITCVFYSKYGVGALGLHKAFRINSGEKDTSLEPIRNISHVRIDDLVGYDIAKKKLKDNTEAFINGKKANNCLLYGDAGTGKSTSIKGIINEYYDKGLRMVEVYRHQFRDLNDIIGQIKNRNYFFILYMDDLSFEDFETEYKYLKAIIEGGLEKRPDNVLIYATSNRRHLIRESFRDKEGREDDVHNSDTVQEKLSLSARFGVNIYFGAPDRLEYLQIVQELAQKAEIAMEKESLLAEAAKWEISHGGRSGRTAQQFIDYLSGYEKGES